MPRAIRREHNLPSIGRPRWQLFVGGIVCESSRAAANQIRQNDLQVVLDPALNRGKRVVW
jgi:hypothetical protein